jgi:hypothetical protein
MRKALIAGLLASAFFAAPASAVVLVNGSTNQTPTAFSTIAGTQGTQLAYQTFTGSALTFSATFQQAVYRNASGTLDFYYQVIRNGPGNGTANNNQEIDAFTVSNFDSFFVDGFASAPDPDGAGAFRAANNPTLADGTASGSTTTFGRSNSGNVLRIDFGLNGLTGTENSATYIFRTNATAFNNLGTFGVIDGSTLQGGAFQPSVGVPEPATWAMMLGGFGLIGAAARRRARVSSVTA